jgi:hypothetical protein
MSLISIPQRSPGQGLVLGLHHWEVVKPKGYGLMESFRKFGSYTQEEP